MSFAERMKEQFQANYGNGVSTVTPLLPDNKYMALFKEFAGARDSALVVQHGVVGEGKKNAGALWCSTTPIFILQSAKATELLGRENPQLFGKSLFFTLTDTNEGIDLGKSRDLMALLGTLLNGEGATVSKDGLGTVLLEDWVVAMFYANCDDIEGSDEVPLNIALANQQIKNLNEYFANPQVQCLVHVIRENGKDKTQRNAIRAVLPFVQLDD